MTKVTKAQLEKELIALHEQLRFQDVSEKRFADTFSELLALRETASTKDRQIAELKAELATAISSRDAFFHMIARMTVWHFMVARCARQL